MTAWDNLSENSYASAFGPQIKSLIARAYMEVPKISTQALASGRFPESGTDKFCDLFSLDRCSRGIEMYVVLVLILMLSHELMLIVDWNPGFGDEALGNAVSRVDAGVSRAGRFFRSYGRGRGPDERRIRGDGLQFVKKSRKGILIFCFGVCPAMHPIVEVDDRERDILH